MRLKLVLFTFLPLIFFLVAVEVVLRIIGFQYSDSPLEMHARISSKEGYTRSFLKHERLTESAVKYKKDSHQLWVPRENFAAGFTKNKNPHVTRVITMGCSCTAGCVIQQGRDDKGKWSHLMTYPGTMARYLEAIKPNEFEVLNAGVGGHSSYQGLQRLKHDVLKYHPDIVTIFYGWNDHWVAFLEDKNAKVHSEEMTHVINFFEQFRLYQAMHKLIRLLNKSDQFLEDEENFRVKLRVHPNDYATNLNEMINLLQDHDAHVIMITAPSDLSEFVPSSIFPRSKEKLIALHQTYNDVVRKLSQMKGVVLLDLANEIDADEDLKKKVLLGDGIHFSEFGCDYVAKRVANTVLNMDAVLKLNGN